MNRPSIYLVERATSMIQTIKFFNGASKDMTQNDKHLLFITQLHFWDFEIESLIYVFQTFVERQKDWDNSGDTSIDSKIMKQHLVVKRKYISEFNQNLQHKKRWNPYRFRNVINNVVVAPTDLLIEAIETWNDLLDKCEYLLVEDKDAKTIELAGCGSVLRNLSKFKKTIPEILVNETE